MTGTATELIKKVTGEKYWNVMQDIDMRVWLELYDEYGEERRDIVIEAVYQAREIAKRTLWPEDVFEGKGVFVEIPCGWGLRRFAGVIVEKSPQYEPFSTFKVRASLPNKGEYEFCWNPRERRYETVNNGTIRGTRYMVGCFASA